MTGLRACGAAAVLALSLAGCGSIFLPDTAIMPRTSAGTPVMSDQGAIQLSSYALGVPSRTAGQPGQGARAVAAIDYLAGALYTNPRWTGLSALTKQRMLQGRIEVRQVLGVAPGTPSQVLVNQLIRAADAFDGHDIAAAEAALPASVFTFGPQRTAEILANLPPLPQANYAAQAANNDIINNCQFSSNCG